LRIASAEPLQASRLLRRFLVAFGLTLLAVEASAQPQAFVVDPEASQVRIHLGRAGLLKFMGHEHEIDAPLDRGRIDVDWANPAGSRVDLFWRAPLLAVVPGTEPAEDVPEVEERMRGPEVLDVGTYSEIRFWSFEIQVQSADPAAGLWALRMKGGVELRGARYTVEIPVEVHRDGPSLVATGEAELRLRRLGVEPPSVGGVVKVKDEFRLAFEIHARAPDDGP